MLDTQDIRQQCQAIRNRRKKLWRSKVMPQFEQKAKQIPESELRMIWSLFAFVLDEYGNLKDVELGMDLMHWCITMISCDR